MQPTIKLALGRKLTLEVWFEVGVLWTKFGKSIQ